MKTTLDIPEKELKDAIEFTGAKSKREAIVTAVTDYNRRQRLKRLGGQLGSFDGFLSPDELAEIRKMEWSG